MEHLTQQIKSLEESLLQRHTRADQAGASGNMVNKSEAIDWLLREDDNIQWSLSDFQIRCLSDEIVLATYRAHKTDLSTRATKHSLRSSLWMNTGDRWVLRFHQGTNLAK
ncbi:MAG: hypothetical protein AMJ55_05345 [Gammaproteobacteria bacterium SG8_15]|nr:MAG: hypothetical protein AMJ55_05345 [Gammaproteobacteria bacterium SG8_15]